MKTIKIRSIPVSKLKVREDYRDLLPRHKDWEYLQIMNSMEICGFLPQYPIVINEDLVVLDGHARVEIARELGLERVWASVRQFEDHYDERLFILETALAPCSTPETRADIDKEIAQIEAEGGVVDLDVARVARMCGLSYKTFLKVSKIQEIARIDPLIADAHQKAVRGETRGDEAEIEELYQLALQREKSLLN